VGKEEVRPFAISSTSGGFERGEKKKKKVGQGTARWSYRRGNIVIGRDQRGGGGEGKPNKA